MKDYYSELRRTLIAMYVGEQRQEYLGLPNSINAHQCEQQMVEMRLKMAVDTAVACIIKIVIDHNDKFGIKT